MSLPSFEYRAMICFAHSTLVIYSKSIISEPDMSIKEFRNKNEAVIKRVFDEGLTIFNYELSWLQIDKAINVYLFAKYKPTSVFETEVYTLK